MSDDFGTVNMRRGDRAREIEVLRQHYRTHRDTLGRLIADAPTEFLAAEYQRLIGAIDDSLRKLDELEGRPASPATAPGTLPGRTAVPAAAAAAGAAGLGATTSPGMRPLSQTPAAEPATEPAPFLEARPAGGSRTMIIVAVGVLVLAAIAYLIWRASDRNKAPATSTVVEQPLTTAPETAPPVTPAPASATAVPAGGVLKVTPALQDYGVIRKGTRAVRQFDAVNGGSTPIEIQVPRSACRCLFYEYKAKIAPGAKERITVTVDGGKAKAGPLNEQLTVTAKKEPSVTATIGVRAVIQ